MMIKNFLTFSIISLLLIFSVFVFGLTVGPDGVVYVSELIG